MQPSSKHDQIFRHNMKKLDLKHTDLLRCLHTKYASYDANSKLRARLAFYQL